MTPHTTLPALLALLIGVAPLTSRADDAAPAPQPPGFLGSLLGSKSELVVGAGLAFNERYPGAGAGRLLPVPVLSLQRGALFADTTRGLGLQYQSQSGLYLSQSVFYDAGAPALSLIHI